MFRIRQISMGVGVALLLFPATGPARESADTARLPNGVQRVMLPHPGDAERQVELYWVEPKGEDPVPAVLFVHGHQFETRPGGRFYVDRGALKRAAKDGFFAAAVSQPGYGRSDGPPDFCGPMSQQAVEAALAHLRRHPRIDASRVGLFGRSRGAVVSSMVATRDDQLAALVLSSGEYDLPAAVERMDEDNWIHAGIKRNIVRESGGTPEALRARAALHAETPIRVPTLILHGDADVNTRFDSARALARSIRDAGASVEMVIYQGAGHRLPRESSTDDPARRFLARRLQPR